MPAQAGLHGHRETLERVIMAPEGAQWCWLCPQNQAELTSRSGFMVNLQAKTRAQPGVAHSSPGTGPQGWAAREVG